MPTPVERLRAHLTAVYGSAQTAEILEQLRPRLEAFGAPSTGLARERVSERDAPIREAYRKRHGHPDDGPAISRNPRYCWPGRR